VTAQDVTDLLRVEQRVVGGKDGSAGDTEDVPYPLLLQGMDEGLGPRELLSCLELHLASFR
jgi:hypothetical protein